MEGKLATRGLSLPILRVIGETSAIPPRAAAAAR
jgi:hypothetical protein